MRKNIGRFPQVISFLIGAFCVLMGSKFALGDTIIDLTSVNSFGTINGAYFFQALPQPTGTGVIDPFLTIKQKGQEQGFNTDAGPQPPLDDLRGGASNAYTHSLLINDLQIIVADRSNDGVNNPLSYYEFLLDINESNAGDKTLLSLNNIELWTGDAASPGCQGRYTGTGCTSGGNGFLNEWWSLDTGADNGITLKYGLGRGSGSGDMYMDIPVSAFAGNTHPYLYLYSQFGNPPGLYSSDAGFEEWAANESPQPVPEPTSLLLMGTGLLGFAKLLNTKRKSKA